MNTHQNKRILENLPAIIAIYRQLFFNQKNDVALQIFRKKQKKPGWGYTPVPLKNDGPALDAILREHLLGQKTYGFYSHSREATCRWLCLDIDLKVGLIDDRFDHVAYVLGLVHQRVNDLGIPEAAILMDFSGSKGIHLWVMTVETPMNKTQNFIHHIVQGLAPVPYDIHIDLFPRPTTDPEKPYGLAMKLPCGLHRGSERFSHFLDNNFCGIIDVLSHLQAVVPCSLPDLPELATFSKVKNSRKPAKPTTKRGLPKDRETGPPLIQPPLNGDLLNLFRECQFLREFRKDPHLARFNEWTRAGLVLCSVGQEGEQWFEYLSSLDQRRYDGSHEELINNFHENGLHCPTCKTINCTHCCRHSPLDTLGTTKRRYRIRRNHDPDDPAEEPVPLERLRDEYRDQLRTVINSHGNAIYLSNFPLGGGKTTIAIEEILTCGVRCLFYCPTHKLAGEIMEQFGTRAFQVFGLEQLQRETGFTCPHAVDIRNSVELGVSTRKYCDPEKGKCRIRTDCAYLHQFDQAARADAVVLVHNHLGLGERKRGQLLADRQLVVIDEAFLKVYREERIITRTELEAFKAADKASCTHSQFSHLYAPLFDFLVSDDAAIRLSSTFIYPKEFGRIDSIFVKRSPGIRNPLRDLYRSASEGLTIRRKDNDTLAVNLPVFLPSGLPVLILDATATAEDYQRLLGKPVITINPAQNRRLVRHARTVQIVSGGYSNSSLVDKGVLTHIGERIIEFVKSHRRNEEDYGIICTMKMEEILIARGDFPPERIMHFNDLRGMNTFTGILDLFIIGFQGISYLEMTKQARILFDQDWDDEEIAKSLAKNKQFLGLQMNGKQSCEVFSLLPQNEFVRSYYNLCVKGEVEQAIGRARLYSDCGKADRRVYLITGLPTSLEIDEPILLSTSTNDNLIGAAEQLLDERGEFSRAELGTRAQCTDRTLRKKIGQVMMALDLEEISRGHNRKLYRRIDRAAP